jgi:hypothetical protein
MFPKTDYSNGLCQEDADGGRWLVTLRHKTGQTNLFKDSVWEDYAAGFGTPNIDSTAFWLGLREVHQLTSTGRWQVLLKVKWDKLSGGSNDPRKGTTGYEVYNDFKVGPESGNFKLTVGSLANRCNIPTHSSNGYGYNNGKQFSTKDRGPQQRHPKVTHEGAWWFGNCGYLCLTCHPNSPYKHIWQSSDWHIPSDIVMAIRVIML